MLSISGHVAIPSLDVNWMAQNPLISTYMVLRSFRRNDEAEVKNDSIVERLGEVKTSPIDHLACFSAVVERSRLSASVTVLFAVSFSVRSTFCE